MRHKFKKGELVYIKEKKITGTIFKEYPSGRYLIAQSKTDLPLWCLDEHLIKLIKIKVDNNPNND